MCVCVCVCLCVCVAVCACVGEVTFSDSFRMARQGHAHKQSALAMQAAARSSCEVACRTATGPKTASLRTEFGCGGHEGDWNEIKAGQHGGSIL